MNKKAIATWSGGKDSMLACYKAMQAGYQITALANSVSEEYERVRFHGTCKSVIQLQAQAVGIPLIQHKTSGHAYEEDFKGILREALGKKNQDIIFGDIHLADCRRWAEKISGDLNTKAVEPLWHLNTERILEELIRAGFKAVIVSAQASLLDREWIGRIIDHEVLKEFKALGTIDLCGENGEYHTLVIDGPIFKQKIDLLKTEIIKRDNYWFLDIQEYALCSKN